MAAPISTSSQEQSKRRFAPVGRKAGGNDGAVELKGIVFDMDGTLCK